ncbi:MAG: hypothetical protein ACP5I8_02555 [Phycisphaerae bacterium]
MQRREFIATLGAASLAAGHLDSLAANISAAVAPSPRAAGKAVIPSADELAGQWMSFGDLHTLPTVNNTLGGCQVGTDLFSVQALEFPPYCQGGGSRTGPNPAGGVRIFDSSPQWGSNGALRINGVLVATAAFRWFPYQVLRRASIGNGNLQLESTTRLRQRTVLWQLVIKNDGPRPQHAKVEASLLGMIRRVPDGWTWDIPRPENPHEFKAALADVGRVLVISDSRTSTCVAFAFGSGTPDQLTAKDAGGTAFWNLQIEPGHSVTIEVVMAVGDQAPQVTADAMHSAKAFIPMFEEARQDWDNTFHAAFQPGNKLFSGHLPTLETADADIRRVYYVSVVSLLAMFRRNFPVAPHAYITASPQYGASLMYFWDTFTWATIHALLDPVDMKNMLRRWLNLNIHSCYAQDMLSGHGVGPWYSFNDFVVFNQFVTYIRITGDKAFLEENVAGRSVMDQLEQMALWWKRLVKSYSPLADYGASWNLLECVPTYTHVVVSLNAANVWMMRQTAELRAAQGKQSRALRLRQEADRLAGEVLKLYVPGSGYWNTVQPDGARVPVRHCIDFFTVAYCMADDLSASMKREMTDFVKKQLLTDHWMRALSLEDPAAPESNRPDHGPMGAYDAWPPFTMEALCRLGDWSHATAFLRRCAEVTQEGPYGQSHELLTTGSDSPVRKALRGEQVYNASCAGAFAEIIIRNFFGLQCRFDGTLDLFVPQAVRGFEGSLKNIGLRGRIFDIHSGASGIKLIANAPIEAK